MSARRRRGRKQTTDTRALLLVEVVQINRCSVNFVYDKLVTDRRMRTLNVVGALNVVDGVAKGCLTGVFDTSNSRGRSRNT